MSDSERRPRSREELLKEYGVAGIMWMRWEAKKGRGPEEWAQEWREVAEEHLEGVEEGKGWEAALAWAAGFLVLVAAAVAVGSWEFFKQEAEAVRNLVLIIGAPLALGLAVWRSWVAGRQVKVGEGGVLNGRYQRAIEMMGHEYIAVRVGGIHALRNLALEHPQYNKEVGVVLNLFARGKGWEPVMEDAEMGMKVPADEWEAELAGAVLAEARSRRT